MDEEAKNNNESGNVQKLEKDFTISKPPLRERIRAWRAVRMTRKLHDIIHDDDHAGNEVGKRGALITAIAVKANDRDEHATLYHLCCGKRKELMELVVTMMEDMEDLKKLFLYSVQEYMERYPDDQDLMEFRDFVASTRVAIPTKAGFICGTAPDDSDLPNILRIVASDLERRMKKKKEEMKEFDPDYEE